MSATLITRWYVEQPDKRIEVEVKYIPNQGFAVEGHIHIYHTNGDGTRGALRAGVPFSGTSSGSLSETDGRYSSGSSGGSEGSDTDGASSEIARTVTSGLEVISETGSGPRTRGRVPYSAWEAPNQS